jgi:hypothetical protein
MVGGRAHGEPVLACEALGGFRGSPLGPSKQQHALTGVTAGCPTHVAVPGGAPPAPGRQRRLLLQVLINDAAATKKRWSSQRACVTKSAPRTFTKALAPHHWHTACVSACVFRETYCWTRQ